MSSVRVASYRQSLLCLFFLSLCSFIATSARAQERTRVFLDCSACDFNYLREEVKFVDYVRDRTQADVHVLTTTQGTGGGGTEYVFKFIGLGRFAGVDDELKFTAQRTHTSDERRAGYTAILKLGLVRYVAGSDLAGHLQLTYRPPGENQPTVTAAADPWNLWSFQVRGSGSVNGEQSSGANSWSTSASANRTSDAWKFNSNINLNFRENTYTLSDGEELVDNSHDHNASALLVKSLSDHWSAAVRARWASATFLNQERALRAAGGVEYSFFPYRLSARKELIAQLTLGVTKFDYIDTTIYLKDEETVADLFFITQFNAQQPWGSTGVSFETSAYLHDPERNRLAVFGDVDVRIFRGLSLSVDGNVSRIRDQLYLKAGEATDEEILLRRRQLATGYRYRLSVGFSYTFGSIFNNIVNTRF